MSGIPNPPGSTGILSQTHSNSIAVQPLNAPKPTNSEIQPFILPLNPVKVSIPGIIPSQEEEKKEDENVEKNSNDEEIKEIQKVLEKIQQSNTIIMYEDVESIVIYKIGRKIE